jgi:hypothetical protein
MHRPRPDQPDQLEILMHRYAAVRLAPGPERITEGRAAVLEAFASHTSRISSRRQRRPVLRGWSLAAAFALLLVAGSGLVAAESGPGQPFYGLRLAIGSATLPVNEPAHDRGLAAQLDDRLTEVRAATQVGDGRAALAAIHEYLNTLNELARNGVTDPAILALLQRHEGALEQLLSAAPSQATSGVQQALDTADKVDGVPHATPPQGDGASAPATGKP